MSRTGVIVIIATSGIAQSQWCSTVSRWCLHDLQLHDVVKRITNDVYVHTS